jgi:hypothetical protein
LKWTAAALTMLWLSALLLPELLLSAGSAVWLGFQIPGRERAAALSGALVGLTLGWLSLVSWGRHLGLPI